MTDYTKLVEALRMCQFGSGKCPECSYYGQKGNWHEDCDDKMHRDAAAAIEDLEGFLSEAERDRDEYEERMRKEQERVLDLQARLEEAENSVERWKDMYLTKHEPKRVEFEKSLHEMFDSIWDCDINHPIFQDTVGELMEAVLQAYDTVNRARMEVQE